MTIRISPSILAADFANLQRSIETVPSADLLHVDVMDGHFVPNLTFGPGMVRRLHEISALPLDVHLMIDDPDRWAPDYAAIGAFSVTFHAEASRDPVALARKLRASGARAGLALRPGTPVEPYVEMFEAFDQILVMTVEPGFGGQGFMASTLEKVRRVRAEIDAANLSTWLQVDGGIDAATIRDARGAGADTFVAGSAVFGADDPDAAVRLLRIAASSSAPSV